MAHYNQKQEIPKGPRGMLIGMVLGALHGVEAIPERLISGLNAGDEIQNWLGKAELPNELSAGTNKFEFQNQAGEPLAAPLESPPAIVFSISAFSNES
ncbi:ADP-ribosylglycohydrolase family protein [Verrucomicrobiales bacterium]|nr:ADP-ribosylglycohydrolase family protein [Verrucomicrobiales bacterium]